MIDTANSSSNFSIFQDQINKILDTKIIEDDQIKFLKAKLLKGQIGLNNFLKKPKIEFPYT